MDQDNSQRKKVEIIVQEVRRLEQILKMILSYIRPIQLEFSEVDLNALLLEAISGSEDKFDNRGIGVELDLDEKLPSMLADRGHLRRALEIILRHACNHMPEKSRLKVATTWNGAAGVKLSYPALHLAEDDMEHFFYPFKVEELGEADLEVPMTKVVIHKHGGTINIARDDGQIIITISFAPMGQGRKDS
jgi:signal transduction histidine kinase